MSSWGGLREEKWVSCTHIRSVLCLRASFHNRFLLKGEFRPFVFKDVILINMLGSDQNNQKEKR